jgi:HlyD family secretion protein
VAREAHRAADQVVQKSARHQAIAQQQHASVETAEEREKLMFRVKLQADREVLNKYHRQVKTGVRGLGFVRTDPKAPWPAELTVKLPP